MTINDRLLDSFHDEEYRREYADGLTDAFIATQIQVLREQRKLNQEQLAALAGLGQSQISSYEDVDNSSWTGRTLKKFAKAFDLRLVVRFESFGTTLHEVDSLDRAKLERPSFKDDPAFGPQAEQPIKGQATITKLIEHVAKQLPDDRSRFSGVVCDVA